MGRSKGLLEKIKNNPKKTIAVIGLAGLIAITTAKDNVHFNSITLDSPQENHYTFGILPTTEIRGDAKGNFYTIGLIVGENLIRENSSIVGDMSVYGLIVGVNSVEENSSIVGDMYSHGLVMGLNLIKENSSIVGDMSAYGLIVGANDMLEESIITGNIFSHGITTMTPTEDGMGLSETTGLKNHTIKRK